MKLLKKFVVYFLITVIHNTYQNETNNFEGRKVNSVLNGKDTISILNKPFHKERNNNKSNVFGSDNAMIDLKARNIGKQGAITNESITLQKTNVNKETKILDGFQAIELAELKIISLDQDRTVSIAKEVSDQTEIEKLEDSEKFPIDFTDREKGNEDLTENLNSDSIETGYDSESTEGNPDDCDMNRENSIAKSDRNNNGSALKDLEIDKGFKKNAVFDQDIQDNKYVDIYYSPLVTQRKRVRKPYKRKGKQTRKIPKNNLANYHENIGIPSAQLLQEQELGYSSSTKKLTNQVKFRIVRGKPANLGDFPYLGGLIILLSSDRLSVCGSSILTHNHILTAAHCGMDADHVATNVTAVFGTLTIFKGGTRRIVSKVTLHPQYQAKTMQNDVAVLTIPFLKFDEKTINRIVLPSGPMMNQTYVGTWLRACGFGRVSDDEMISKKQTLQQVDMKVISNAQCSLVYGKQVITSKNLCADSSLGGTCSGDSGGPLAFVAADGRHVLIGVTSFGSNRGCEKQIPLGYSRVACFKTWIMEQVTNRTKP